ncbi:MAG: BrnA antitoxin family protein [Pseudomonadota bacterium]|nr:BrnA antitoxin family protein [Pseudomonadota bacterium]MEE3099319.1 BrnA antitoxin family protein [Pseudomonadota bacterium]
MTNDERDWYDPDFDGASYDLNGPVDRAMKLTEKGLFQEAQDELVRGERDMKRWAAWKEFDARERAIRDVLLRAWRETTSKVEVRPRQTRVTLRLDEDVAKWFRKLGPGYGRRVNAVLRDYAMTEGFRGRR